MRLHIAGARLLDPAAATDVVEDIFVASGKIVARGAMPPDFFVDRYIDAHGLALLPGLIDLSANLAPEKYDGVASKVDERRAALAGGVTRAVVAAQVPEFFDEPPCTERAVQGAFDPIAGPGPTLHPLGAGLTHQWHQWHQSDLSHRPLQAGQQHQPHQPGQSHQPDQPHQPFTDMTALAASGCIAFTDTVEGLPDTAMLGELMRSAHSRGYSLWFAPRHRELMRHTVAADGAYASRLGLRGSPVQAETIAIFILVEMLRASGGRLHIRHLSSAAGVQCVRMAKREGLAVTCDVTINHLHLCDVDIGYYDTRCRLDPPLRSQRDRDAIRQGLADGTIDAVCSDHQPVSDAAKAVAFGVAQPGASGIELLLPLVLRWAAQERVPLLSALGRVTSAPAAILRAGDPRVPACGTLACDALADFCLVDLEEYWIANAQTLQSSSIQTPFLGSEMAGRVRATYVGGRLVWEMK